MARALKISKMKFSQLLAAFILCAGLSTIATAANYYVFPIEEIEGLNKVDKAANVRPLIDSRAVDLLPPDAQKKILGTLAKTLSIAYPSSIIHSQQVRDALKGKHQYLPNGTSCGEGFVAPIASSYAIVAGITRASYYQVDRGENIEILVPITLNIQVVKAERAKIAYSTSSTQYTPFIFTKKEMEGHGAKDAMIKALTQNTINQLTELLEHLKNSFNPKDTRVKLLSGTKDFVVADKGFDVGFRTGDELEAHALNGVDAAVIFKVLSVDRNYSVLKSLDGSPKIGTDYNFVFEGAAEDGNKPKLMPVPKLESVWSVGVADLFTKDIGFGAAFEMSPVDVNFQDTMNSISRLANCVPWGKYPSAAKVFDSRLDHPDYFLRFELGQSPVFLQQGSAAVKSEETFITVLTAQVADKEGNVIFSVMGKDTYLLERVSKQGISLENAKEISTKNALVDLIKSFRQNVKLEPKEFVISDVRSQKFTAKGLEVPAGQNVTYEVFHPTGLKANGVDVFVKLILDAGAEPPVSSAGQTVFSYANASPDYPPLSNGDLLRVLTMPKGNMPELSACGSVYLGKDSLIAEQLVPILNDVAYRSQNHIVSLAGPEFYESTNKLLKDGFYKIRLKMHSPTDMCFKPGYMVKLNEKKCDADACDGKLMTAIKLVIEKKGTEIKDSAIGEQTVVKGFNEKQAENLAGVRALISGLNIAPELSKRFNSK